MKAARFDYERPNSLSEALALLQQSHRSAKPLAGGQSLVPMMNLGLVNPDMIVDLSGLRDLRCVQEERDHLFIGAMVTHAEIEDGRLPDTTLGMLRHVAPCIGPRGIRNRGTISGNLAHGDPAADWPAALLALGADAQVVGPTGRHTVPLLDFYSQRLFYRAPSRGAARRRQGAKAFTTRAMVLLPGSAGGKCFARRDWRRRHRSGPWLLPNRAEWWQADTP